MSEFISTSKKPDDDKQLTSLKTKDSSLKGIIIRSRKNVFSPQTERITKRYNFKEINNGLPSKGIKTPMENILFHLDEVKFLLKNLGKYRKADIIITIGLIAIPLKLLIKLGIVKCKKLLWFGFFVHSEKAFKIAKVVLNLLKLKNETMILNSQVEVDLYSEKLNLDKKNLTYMPVGDWVPNSLSIDAHETDEGEYYFAGGYTNRDYKGLIKAFTGRKEKLIIVGSKLNKDLNSETQPDANIKILKDIDKAQFESLLAHAKACILPLRDKDAGASGHMVLLSYMRQRKPIISPDFEAMKEYLEDGKTGILYKDIRKDLPIILTEIQEGKYNLEQLATNALNDYDEFFTYEPLAHRLDEIMDEALASCRKSKG